MFRSQTCGGIPCCPVTAVGTFAVSNLYVTSKRRMRSMTPMMRNILFHGRLAMTVARNRATLTMNRSVDFPARRSMLSTFFELL